MKIAIVYDMIYPFNIGGAEIRNWEIATRLAKDNEVHLFGFKLWDGPDVIKRDGVIIHGVCKYSKFKRGYRTVWESIKFAFFLFWPLRREKFDIIDTSSFAYFHCFTCKLVSVINKTPLVFVWHQYWDDYWYSYLGRIKGFFGKQIEKIVKYLTKNHIAVSQTTKKDLINFGVKEKNIFVSYNGVDFSKINSVSVGEKEYDIVFVGRLSHQKNISLLIKSISIIKKDFPNIKIAIVGDGPIKNKLKKLTRDLDLKNNIIFFGFLEKLEDVYQKIKSAKLFVLPSVLEGFGIVVVEAYACGLPVVVVKSKWNASQELIEEGKTGFIADNNEYDLAEKIKSILGDKNLLEKMSQNALQKANQFNWDNLVEELEDYYKKIIL